MRREAHVTNQVHEERKTAEKRTQLLAPTPHDHVPLDRALTLSKPQHLHL